MIASLALVLSAFAGPSIAAPAPPWWPAFERLPLDTPLVITGAFGERRPRHFHAGLDFSTGGAIGRPVYAPASGWIERVRCQSAGYGRSLYLHTRDGRLVVLGHLDAFDGAIAEYVAAAQDSTLQYEQDLWPARGQLAVRAGERLAWSGASGTTDPHLHLEVRVGDMALNPLRAGVPVPDAIPPRLTAVTLEPLDERSWVERGPGPLTRLLGSAAETVLVEGRVRLLVRADDPGLRGARLAPLRLRATFGESWVEWCADSASWVGDMADVDYLYDVGRVVPAGTRALQLWSPPGARPRLLRASAPESLAAGTIEVRPGDPPRALRVRIEDAAGLASERMLWLRGPAPGERGVTALGTGRFERVSRRRVAPPPRRWMLAALPDRRLRVTLLGAPADLRRLSICGVDASRRAGEWSAVLDLSDTEGFAAVASGTRATGAAWVDSAEAWVVARERGTTGRSPADALEWTLEPGSRFERVALLVATASRPVVGSAELVPLGPGGELGPASLPLKRGIRLRLPAAGPLAARAGLYGEFGDGWEWLGGRASEGDAVSAESRRLGRFAALADTMAPRVTVLRPLRRPIAGPYSTWSLRARVTELGSGVDARGSAFVVDGVRVVTEWDAVRRILRWRPVRPPVRGVHRWELEVRDRAGNTRRNAGTFVLD